MWHLDTWLPVQLKQRGVLEGLLSTIKCPLLRTDLSYLLSRFIFCCFFSQSLQFFVNLTIYSKKYFFSIYLVDFSGAWLVSSQFSPFLLQLAPKQELPFSKNRVARGFASLVLVSSASVSLERVFRKKVLSLFLFQ